MKHSERSQARLTRSLRTLYEIEASSETPSRVEAALMARWDAEHRPRRAARLRTRRIVRAATAVAAGIALVSALVWQRTASEQVVAHDTAATMPDRSRESDVGRYTTVAVVGGPLMDGEPIRVVRMRVARSVLGELGIPSSVPRGAGHAGTVDIDVLVGEDGVARGVRVPISEL